MHHKLSVLVQVDLDGKHVRLVVTGCVTELNHRALCPLVRRARSLVPGIAVIVDVTAARHVEPAAVDLLRWAVEHEDAVPDTRPVEFLLPDELPEHVAAAQFAAWAGARRSAGAAPEPAGPQRPVRHRTAPRPRLAS